MFWLLLACSGAKESGEETLAPPTVSWLEPADAATLAAGDATASVVVENFSLQDPAKHNEGAPIGYVQVLVDGAEMLKTGQTSFSLSLTAGSHTLGAALFYSDGDEVLASDTALCDEDATTGGCSAVKAEIQVTVQ